MTQADIFTFLKEKEEKLGVLATANNTGVPECAVVGYAAKDDGTIILNTNKNTRKVKNIKENNKVALVIGWSFHDKNVQYEGMAEIIERGHPDFSDCESFFFSANPKAAKFKSPDTIHIRIAPTWVKMLDLTVTPPQNAEFSL